MAKRRGSSTKARWHLWSTREGGVLAMPKPIERLPKGAIVSADGGWAELHDGKDIERVFVNLTGARVPSPPVVRELVP